MKLARQGLIELVFMEVNVMLVRRAVIALILQ
jgi:hypothetical protein